MENYIKSFNEFINEGSRFGVPFDPKASTHDTQYPTKPMKAPRYSASKGISQRELNNDGKGIRLEEIKKFDAYVNKGLEIIKKFVETTDFTQFMIISDRGSDASTNFEDKAYIYHTLTGYLGGYSQYGIRVPEVAYIGIKGNLKEFDVENANWSGKFGGGATESWPAKRPQLILKRTSGLSANRVVEEIIEELPTLEKFWVVTQYGHQSS